MNIYYTVHYQQISTKQNILPQGVRPFEILSLSNECRDFM